MCLKGWVCRECTMSGGCVTINTHKPYGCPDSDDPLEGEANWVEVDISSMEQLKELTRPAPEYS